MSHRARLWTRLARLSQAQLSDGGVDEDHWPWGLIRGTQKRIGAEAMGKVPGEIRDAMDRADLALAATEILNSARVAGDAAPDFDLPDARGGTVRLSRLLNRGPVVLSFYRGGWCPYRNLELKALQPSLPDIERLGATLVAVSPETPDETLSTVEKNALAFAMLSDTGSRVREIVWYRF